MDDFYNYEWLLEVMIKLRTARCIIPIFEIDENCDPEEIKDLKNRLYKIKSELENLEIKIYDMIKNEKNSNK